MESIYTYVYLYMADANKYIFKMCFVFQCYVKSDMF